MIINIIISILIGLFIGYKWGYTTGKKKGIEIARARAPLNLLQKSLLKGYCLICNEKNKDFKQEFHQ